MIVHMTWPPINFILEPSGSLVSHFTVALHFPFAHLESEKMTPVLQSNLNASN